MNGGACGLIRQSTCNLTSLLNLEKVITNTNVSNLS